MQFQIMSTQKLFQGSLALALTLTLANIAAARRPPAVAEAQERTNAVVATCSDSRGRITGGYRDMLARSVTPASATKALADTPQLRKTGDHLVLMCEGGEIHQGSGYRDFPARLMPEVHGIEVATQPSRVGVRQAL